MRWWTPTSRLNPLLARQLRGDCITLAQQSTAGAVEAILRLLPIDTFVDRPITRIAKDGKEDYEEPSHLEVRHIIETNEGALNYGILTRFDFYAAAKRAYAVVQTGDQRPYGCFLIKKGVVFADENRLEV